jgi:integrase
MDNSTTMMTTALPLADLAEDWLTELEGQGKSPATLAAYRQGVTGFLAWHAGKYPAAEAMLDRATANAFLTDLRRAGRKPATRRIRYTALRRFSAWLVAVGEADADVLGGMAPPKLDKPLVPRLTDDELRRLFAACKGAAYLDVRDMALARLMAQCGLRAAEALALRVEDVDVRAGVVAVVRGKGGKGRVASFGPQTAAALNRYLRARRRHPLASREALWLPGGGRRTFQYTGLSMALAARAGAAGIEKFHLHKLRHTGASRWLAEGGSEQGLMTQFGWSSRAMLDRYTSDTAAERSLAEARRLNLGDVG